MFTCLARDAPAVLRSAAGERPDTGTKELVCSGAPPCSHPSHQSVVQGDGGGSAPCGLAIIYSADKTCKCLYVVCDVLLQVFVRCCKAEVASPRRAGDALHAVTTDVHDTGNCISMVTHKREFARTAEQL